MSDQARIGSLAAAVIIVVGVFTLGFLFGQASTKSDGAVVLEGGDTQTATTEGRAGAHGGFPALTTDVHEREDYILGHPPRLDPVPPEERTPEQEALLEDLGTIVVDGRRQPRTDLDSLVILAHHPELYRAHVAVAQVFLAGSEMSIRDRELAILRIGWLSQAPFEWGSHVTIARRNGVTTEEIEWVIEGSNAAGWNDHDRALIRAMEELHFDSMISDETWAALAETYDERQLMEVPILAGQYKTIAYLQNSLRLPLPEGTEGLTAR